MQDFIVTKQQLFTIMDKKEIFWRQRSKQLWLQAGDKNTKYFHAACNTRQRTNRIQKLKNDMREWVNWNNDLQALITEFYSNLFTSTNTSYDEVIDCVSQTITHAHNQQLCSEVTKEEVKCALFNMHPDKAPGPDDMTPVFFQRHWELVGYDVFKLVQEFFRTREIMQSLNDIVLIHKKKNPVTTYNQ